jgi:hypothetical protein
MLGALGHDDRAVAARDVDDVLDAQRGSVEVEGCPRAGRHAGDTSEG